MSTVWGEGLWGILSSFHGFWLLDATIICFARHLHFQVSPGGCLCCQSLSHVSLSATPWTAARQAPLSMGFPGKNTGVGCHFLLQGIFLTHGLNPNLLHWQVDSLPLWHLGSPREEQKTPLVENHCLRWIVATFHFSNPLQAPGVSLASSEEWGGAWSATWKTSTVKVHDWGFLASVLPWDN